MFSIDGLVTGLDTSSIINGLLNIQKRQIDVLNARRGTLLGKKASFAGIESRLLSFRGALNQLTSIQRSAMNAKSVTSSHETIIQAAASDTAVAGTYQLRVHQLATSHQIASNGFDSADEILGTGSVIIQSADDSSTTIEIDENNNTLRGLADAINGADAGLTASIINDGSGDTPYRLLIASKATGAERSFSVSASLDGGPNVTFDQIVQQASNSIVSFGDGAGAITISHSTNKLDNVIDGVTLDLRTADTATLVTLTVQNNTQPGVDAVKGLVDAYNDLVNYVNQQSAFNTATNVGGPLLGERSITSIRDELQLSLTGTVGGLNTRMNRLSALGVSVQNDGTLALNETRLQDVLAGRVEGLSAADAARLFALGADSTNTKINFVAGSSKTLDGTVHVEITQAARQATITAASIINGPVTIGDNNDTISIVIDGVSSGTLTLAHGEYTAEQLATQLQSTINQDSELGSRDVKVSVVDGKLAITSESYGSSSEVKLLAGTAWTSLGFEGSEADTGLDVAGIFIVNGVEETATGRGTLLIGAEGNRFTADLQVRVRIEAHELTDGYEATLSITRGLASRADQLIGKLTDPQNGRVKTINQRFEQTDGSIQSSIDRLNKQFESQRERLVKEFAALESAVNRLQGTANFLSSQLTNLVGLR